MAALHITTGNHRTIAHIRSQILCISYGECPLIRPESWTLWMAAYEQGKVRHEKRQGEINR